MSNFALVSPELLERRIERAKGTGQGPGPVILEAHFSSFDHPLDGDLPVCKHVPDAIQVHPSYLESGTDTSKYYPHYQHPNDGNILPTEELIEALGALGITREREIWVYGTEPDGIMAAARLIWGLMVAGIETIRLVDGGIDAWLEHGGDTVQTVRKAVEIAEPRRSIEDGFPSREARSRFLANLLEIQALAKGELSSARLVDVRRPEEFSGTETRYYPFFSKAGHIPGAILQGNWINLVDPASRKIGPVLEDVRRRWVELGIVDDPVESGARELIFYCGTGWRSSLSFLTATLLGYRARNFDHGFYGWSWSGENPVVYGMQHRTSEVPLARS